MISVLTDNNLFKQAMDDGNITVGKAVSNTAPSSIFYGQTKIDPGSGVLKGKNMTNRDL